MKEILCLYTPHWLPRRPVKVHDPIMWSYWYPCHIPQSIGLPDNLKLMQLDSRPPWTLFQKSLVLRIALGTTNASEPADVRVLAIGVALDTIPARTQALSLAIFSLELKSHFY